jgi:hypothetical protein
LCRGGGLGNETVCGLIGVAIGERGVFAIILFLEEFDEVDILIDKLLFLLTGGTGLLLDVGHYYYCLKYYSPVPYIIL